MMIDGKMMLAEDDLDDRLIFEEVFREIAAHSLTLESVEDGIELINKLKLIQHDEELPKLFVLDQNMPKMTGKATLTFLKSHDRYKHIPVIIYSTYPDDRLIEEFKCLGADMVTSKPDSYEGFKDMIRSFLAAFSERSNAEMNS